MNVAIQVRDAGPWYRQPWPWLLMAGPCAVVIAGIFTYWLSVSSFDGMVADDYYKRGLAINQTLQRTRAAERMALKAHVRFEADARRVLVRLQGEQLPEALRLTLVHPTRAMADEVVVLRGDGAGEYVGNAVSPHDGRRFLMLEDLESSWRLAGEAVVRSAAAVDLTP